MIYRFLERLRNIWFNHLMSKLNANRQKEPPPPPTKLDELLAFAERLNEDVERFSYRFSDGIDEGLIGANEVVTSSVATLKFASGRIKDELLIKVQNQ
jgi:hypothetical protein